MAHVQLLRGVRYDTARLALADVVSPPYDVVSPAEAQAYRRRSPYNAVHIDMPLSEGGDPTDCYAHAARLFAQWQREGVLVRDEEPAFYLLDETYHGPDGYERSRRGFIGRLRLEDRDAGVVLPHEKTNSAPKADRLSLLRAAHANFSPIFMVYPDDRGEIGAALAAAEAAALLEAEKLFIADGHHRYATALAYRDERRAAGDHSADHVLVYLCSMTDPGLTIFPTHRLLKGVEIPPMDQVIERLRPTFEVFPERGADSGACQLMVDHLHSFADHGKVFGLYFPREQSCVTVELRDLAAVAHLVDEGFSVEATKLSVTVLHYLIMRDGLGLDPGAMEGKIDYVTSPAQAFRLLGQGDYVLGAFINATLMSEVRIIAERHETLPQKSTYFYPKPPTGLVFALMDNE
jgi:uncharacterized protein (DUF1015 family)